jgi:hypothetical protein
MTGAVPIEWTRIVAAHQFARSDREAMRKAATQQLRDDAAVRYGRTVDEIMDNLSALDDRQELSRITSLLSGRGRC